MKQKLETVGIIPARSNSKGINNKNRIIFDGKSLIDHAINFLSESRFVDYVVVSSNDSKLLQNCGNDVIALRRPEKYSGDESPIEKSFDHAFNYLESIGKTPGIFVWLQPNVPIRKPGIVDEVLCTLIDDKLASAAVTCRNIDPRFKWAKNITHDGALLPLFPEENAFRRQEIGTPLLIDGSVSAFYASNLRETGSELDLHSYLGNHVLPVIQEENIYSLELDEPDDLRRLYEYLNTKWLQSDELLDYFSI